MTPKPGLLTRGKVFALIAVMFLSGAQAMAADGLITIRSSYGPQDTMNRFQAEVRAKGMTVFARIDHAAGAAPVVPSLRPASLPILGKGQGRSPPLPPMHTICNTPPRKAQPWPD